MRLSLDLALALTVSTAVPGLLILSRVFAATFFREILLQEPPQPGSGYSSFLPSFSKLVFQSLSIPSLLLPYLTTTLVDDHPHLIPHRFPRPLRHPSTTVLGFESQSSPYFYELERDIEVIFQASRCGSLIGAEGPANPSNKNLAQLGKGCTESNSLTVVYR